MNIGQARRMNDGYPVRSGKYRVDEVRISEYPAGGSAVLAVKKEMDRKDKTLPLSIYLIPLMSNYFFANADNPLSMAFVKRLEELGQVVNTGRTRHSGGKMDYPLYRIVDFFQL
jgi:hypothetical protein